MSADYVIVGSTTDSEAAALELAAAAVEAKLAACAQILGPLTSVFRWEGEVQTESEWRVEMKTAADRAETLVEYIETHHAYDFPEIVVTPIVAGSAQYLAWIAAETRGQGAERRTG